MIASSLSIERSTDANVLNVAGDISNPETADLIMSEGVDEFGRLDALVKPGSQTHRRAKGGLHISNRRMRMLRSRLPRHVADRQLRSAAACEHCRSRARAK